MKRVISRVSAQTDQTFLRYHLAAIQYQSFWPPALTRSLFCLEGPSSITIICLFLLFALQVLAFTRPAFSYLLPASLSSGNSLDTCLYLEAHLTLSLLCFSPENLCHWIPIFSLFQQGPRMVLLSYLSHLVSMTGLPVY